MQLLLAMQYYPRFSTHVLAAARKEARHDAGAPPVAEIKDQFFER